MPISILKHKEQSIIKPRITMSFAGYEQDGEFTKWQEKGGVKGGDHNHIH